MVSPMTHEDADLLLGIIGQWCKRHPRFKFTESITAQQVLQAIIVQFGHEQELVKELRDYGEHLMVLAGLYEALPGADKDARSFQYARQVGELLTQQASSQSQS